MTYFSAIILGVLQGITEFIPISSDGHLALAENLGLVGDVPFFFTVSVHIGTLLATIYFLRNILSDYTHKAIARDRSTWLLIIGVIVATIPAAFFGFLLNDSIDEISKSLTITGIGFFLSAIWLIGIGVIRNKAANNTQPSIFHSSIIGIFQATALLPGASRSGATIFSGRLTGLTPEKAFEFSFLLSIPAIIGALVLQLVTVNITAIPQSIVGAIVAAIVGYFALSVLKKLLVHNRLQYLAIYCIFLGMLCFVL